VVCTTIYKYIAGCTTRNTNFFLNVLRFIQPAMHLNFFLYCRFVQPAIHLKKIVL